ncbi:hypothetical protein N7526_010970 [Penicillium atrosanguineum]|nr:hypothetical protein N7526_010970 [Penicillium atrosanguineum]
MSKSFKSTAEKLPKSVKVRSTCNACQQAKIRCSHEKPFCRRCQKHKIDCIYSVSRRLGRPAKEKSPRSRLDGQGNSPSPGIAHQQEHTKTARISTRKKGHKQAAASGIRPYVGKARVKPADDKFQSPTDPKKNEEFSALQLDFTSETWLQELMSTRMSWKFTGQTDPAMDQTTDVFLTSSPMGLDPIMVYGILDREFNSFQHSVPDEQLESPFILEPSTGSWIHGSNTALDGCVLSDSWSINRAPSTSFPIDPAIDYHLFESPRPSHDSERLSPGPPDYLEGSQYLACSCYKQTIGELLRSGIKVDWRGISSIDSILACQKELLLQTEAILQCKLCSQSEVQANFLMVIIVTIDSLLTSLDAAATLYKPRSEEGVSAVPVEDGHKAHIDVGWGLKSLIDACPLLVGGFRVPTDDKTCFIRQILHARLSMLIIMIRRICACMQEQVTSVMSRGRFLMIMETDKRLQLIIMKVKMAVG